jgi:hypothetical protein
MATTRIDILDELVTQLETVTGVNKSSRFIDDQPVVENEAPYVAVIPGDEVTQCTDTVNTRYLMRVELVVFTKENYTAIEDLVAAIKNKLYEPIDLGTNCLATELMSVAGPELWESNQNSSARFTLAVVYYAAKAEN